MSVSTPHKLVKYSLYEAQEIVKSKGMEPLFDEYFGLKERIKVRCVCGDIYFPTLERIRKNQKCLKCGYRNRNNRSIPYDEVKEFMENAGCELLTTKDEYTRSSASLVYKCTCGTVTQNNFYNFKQGARCRNCYLLTNRGENHPRYRSDLSDEYRILKRNDSKLKEWSHKVKERDNFTCVFCGDASGGNLNSHHLYNYAEHPEKRYELTNGVTLCVDCHKDFHDMYGYTSNTREQFVELVLKCKVEWGGLFERE